MITQSRPNTVARWKAGLARADAKGVQVRQLAGSGAWIATSASDPLTAYVVSIADCECHAAQHGDPVCCHRAALRRELHCLPWGVGGNPPCPIDRDALLALKAQAAREWLAGGPLIDPVTGEVLADAL